MIGSCAIRRGRSATALDGFVTEGRTWALATVAPGRAVPPSTTGSSELDGQGVAKATDAWALRAPSVTTILTR
jgi:hypothetical protein